MAEARKIGRTVLFGMSTKNAEEIPIKERQYPGLCGHLAARLPLESRKSQRPFRQRQLGPAERLLKLNLIAIDKMTFHGGSGYSISGEDNRNRLGCNGILSKNYYNIVSSK